MISRMKRKFRTPRNIIKNLMHPYALGPGNIASQLSPIINESRNPD